MDNLAKYYALNINTGEVIWSKSNIAPFNSQVKIFKDKFFVVDFENILRCFSIKNGEEIWNFKTENSLIASLFLLPWPQINMPIAESWLAKSLDVKIGIHLTTTLSQKSVNDQNFTQTVLNNQK